MQQTNYLLSFINSKIRACKGMKALYNDLTNYTFSTPFSNFRWGLVAEGLRAFQLDSQ